MNKKSKILFSIFMLLVSLFISSNSLAMLEPEVFQKHISKRHQKQSFLHGPWKVASGIAKNLFGGSNNHGSSKTSTQSSSSTLVNKLKGFSALSIIIGAAATCLYNVYSSYFFNDENDEIEIDPDRKYRDALLDEIKGEEDPVDGGLTFEMSDQDYEEELKEMSKEYWEESHGYVGDSSEYDVFSETDVKEMLVMAMYDYELDLYGDDNVIDMHKADDWMLNAGITESVKGISGQGRETDAGDAGDAGDDGDDRDDATVITEEVVARSVKDLVELRDSTKKNVTLSIYIIGRYSRWLDILIDLIKKRRLYEIKFYGTFHDSRSEARTDVLNQIMDALRCDDSLHALLFDSCKIDGDDLVSIASMLHDNKGLRALSLISNLLSEASDEDLDEFERVLKTSKLEYLSLADNKMSVRVVRLVENVISENSGLKGIDLAGNLIGNEGVRLLSNALSTNKSLEKIVVRNNHIGSIGASSLANGLKTNRSIHTIDIGGNKIGVRGVKAFGDLLRSNDHIRSLGLDACNIDDRKVILLGEGLDGNESLKVLSIRENGITHEGAKSLGSKLGRNMGLEELYLGSNSLRDEGLALVLVGIGEQGVIGVLDISRNGITAKGIGDLLRKSKEGAIRLRNLIIDDSDKEAGVRARNEIRRSNDELVRLFYQLAEDRSLVEVDFGALLPRGIIMGGITAGSRVLYNAFYQSLVSNVHLSSFKVVRSSAFVKKHIALNMYLNGLLRKHFLDLDIRRSGIVKKRMIYFTVGKSLNEIDEDELIRDANEVLNIFIVVDHECEDEEDDGSEIGDEMLREAAVDYYKMLGKVVNSFKKIWFDPRIILTLDEKYYLAETLFFTYQVMANNMEEILKDNEQLSKEDRMKIVMDFRKKGFPYLFYCFGLAREYHLDGKDKIDYLRCHGEWDENRKVLFASLLEFGGQKDGGQEGLEGQGGLLYRDFLKIEEKRVLLIEVFRNLIKEHNEEVLTIWWKEGNPLLYRSTYTLFALQDIRNILRSIREEIELKNKSSKKHNDRCCLLAERIAVLKDRKKVLMQIKEDMMSLAKDDVEREELLESKAIKKIDKELEERRAEMIADEREYEVNHQKIIALIEEIKLLKKDLLGFSKGVFQIQGETNPDIDAFKVMLENKYGGLIEELKSSGEETEYSEEVRSAKRLLELIDVLRDLRME